jgi:hypothetical protein
MVDAILLGKLKNNYMPSGEMVSRFPLEEFFNVRVVGGQFLS